MPLFRGMMGKKIPPCPTSHQGSLCGLTQEKVAVFKGLNGYKSRNLSHPILSEVFAANGVSIEADHAPPKG
jgi:hypothetical protein